MSVLIEKLFALSVLPAVLSAILKSAAALSTKGSAARVMLSPYDNAVLPDTSPLALL